MIAALVILPVSLPLVASASDVDFSSYICGPSGKAISAENQAQLREILIAIGEIDPAPDFEAMEHCSDCVMSAFALLGKSSVTLDLSKYGTQTDPYFSDTNHFHNRVRGPPLGSRAPPAFL